MNFLRLARKNRDVDVKSWDELYESMIIRKIRQKYSVNQELAILRQRDSKPEEFTAYNEYVERCKAEVKDELSV